MARNAKGRSSVQKQLADAVRDEFDNPDEAKALVKSMKAQAMGGDRQAASAMKTLLSYIAGDYRDFNSESEDEILVKIGKSKATTTIELCPHCGKNVTMSPDSVRQDEEQARKTAEEVKLR